MKLDLTTSPSDEDAKTISRGLVEFNRKTIADEASTDGAVDFSVFARDDHGVVLGGLRASCFWNTLHIECMWLSTESRGSGIGSALVLEAERFAIEKGFDKALLETTSWQAGPFYEKLGYELIFSLADYPKGHDMHYMTKQLTP